ncbi:HxlR family transcriptional regulator [Ruminiclostridium sufflavum DSM 19573]|uniref:HxlR family transcriptional regulator n=1 Tax=Ruminiclostridium sufflavum DSM 19573 TaxID=1121337 RepID=A0A318XIN0_9FIRM|nr:helix-turn-helix domain-containing protein [Ruminiclostridium sufflavum]PYG84315.1 HxlR family transcriptional regulator [Ruminiclostridium sufflavum DSM 19573]
MKELICLSINDGHCPVAAAFKLLEGKWKLPILWILTVNGGILRYQDLKRCIIGITNMMLTSSLKELERDGLVSRYQYNEMPPRVEYSLSEDGKKLFSIFDEIAKWGVELKRSKFNHDPKPEF